MNPLQTSERRELEKAGIDKSPHQRCIDLAHQTGKPIGEVIKLVTTTLERMGGMPDVSQTNQLEQYSIGFKKAHAKQRLTVRRGGGRSVSAKKREKLARRKQRAR